MIKEFKIDFAGRSYPAFYLDTKEKAEAAIAKMMESSDVLAADCETMAKPAYRHIPEAALSPHLSTIRLLQMFTGRGIVILDLLKIGELPSIKTLFETRSACFHNISFDYKQLHKNFNVCYPNLECTAIMARICWHALYPDRKSASLKDVIKTLFGENISKKAGATDWSIPELTFEQIQYAGLDAVLQMKVFEKLNLYIDKLNLRKVYDLYRKAQIEVCHMELNGITLDIEKHKKNVIKWRQQLADSRDEVQRITGIGIITDQKIGDWLKKTLPPDVLAIWPTTSEKSDRLSTDSNTLSDFNYLEIVKPFSAYQRTKKLCTSFGIGLLDHINPATKKVHCSFGVAGTKTGRLSCSNFNIQQMPRDKDMRSTFIPSQGYVFVVGDFAQVEVRIAAELSNDNNMLKAFSQGLDIYSFTVANINSKPIKNVTKEERQKGKSLVLGLQFGLGAKKFSKYAKKNYGVEISEQESYAQVDAFRKVYAQLREWQLRQIDQCPVRRYTAFSPMGKSRKMTEDDFYCACLNHPIQSGAAEAILLSLIYIGQAIKGTTCRIVSCIHDEILLECLPEDVEVNKKKLSHAMIKGYSEVFPSGRTLKNLVSPSSGNTWHEAKI